MGRGVGQAFERLAEGLGSAERADCLDLVVSAEWAEGLGLSEWPEVVDAFESSKGH